MSGGLRQTQQAARTTQGQVDNIGKFLNNNLIPITEMNRKQTVENERHLKALEQRVEQDEEDICSIGDRVGMFITTLTFWEKFRWFFFDSLPVRFNEIGRRRRSVAPVVAPLVPPDPEQRQMPPPIPVEGGVEDTQVNGPEDDPEASSL